MMNLIKYRALCLIIIHCVYISASAYLIYGFPTKEPPPQIGIWYSTWYAMKDPMPTQWISDFGIKSENQMVGDMNGDGLEDIIIFEADQGTWQVALSTQIGFASPLNFGVGLGKSSYRQWLADVNNDSRLDAVMFYANNATWTIALHNGNGFSSETVAIVDFGLNSTSQLLGDCNGDGRADLVVVDNSTGTWHIAFSSGTIFVNSSTMPWKSGLGINAQNYFLTDINADLKMDAVAFYNATGRWDAALSNGTAFQATFVWMNGHGSGSSRQLLGDINGIWKADGYPDIMVFFPQDVNGDGFAGDWYCAKNNQRLGTSGGRCVNSGFGANSSYQQIGNVNGDPAGWRSCISFYNETGIWEVQPYFALKPNTHNTWAAWGMKYKPMTLGQYYQYDSSNISVIDEHLAAIAEAKIDFLLLDETNNLYVDEGYIFFRAKVLASRIAAWNTNPQHRPIRYAFVIGGNQYSHDPATIEYEAAEVWDQIVNTTDGGPSNYFYFHGKPLLVDYCLPADQDAWYAWNGSKSGTEYFTFRWAQSPAAENNYGWEVRKGTIQGDEVMLIMPGWNNNKGAEPVSRQNGFFYRVKGWERIFWSPNRPELIVINSFNEYAEETAVWPADTSEVTGNTEPWTNGRGQIDPFMYWNMTTDYINRVLTSQTSMWIPIELIAVYTIIAVISIGYRRKRKKDLRHL